MNRTPRVLIVSRFGTQADFAQALKCQEALVSRVLHGRKQLSPQEQETWAALLDCPVKELFPKDAA